MSRKKLRWLGCVWLRDWAKLFSHGALFSELKCRNLTDMQIATMRS